ncbi:MAG TPA: flagellar biosynthetic protein FliR [Bryobacteraceae bacterium]|nr:flagellar biosynthetic protein FliR [Bryobacteraceae bacterium]
MLHPLTISLPAVLGFVLVLARVSGAFLFVPLPGVNAGPEAARVVLSLSFTMALYPRWPQINLMEPYAGGLVIALLGELALGLTIGVAVAVLSESFLMAGQIIGLQAGYAYASTIDPSTQADSGILVVFAQLTAGLLFFAMGLDREIIRAFARSLDTFPPGTFVLAPSGAEQILRLASGIFSVGLRLAMPALALLLLVDLALALLGRLNAQLQLLLLAFPVKMMAAVGLLAAMAVLFPRVYRGYAEQVMGRVATVVGF